MTHRSVLFWTCWGSTPTITKLSEMPSEAGSVVPLFPAGVDAPHECTCAALADHVSSGGRGMPGVGVGRGLHRRDLQRDPDCMGLRDEYENGNGSSNGHGLPGERAVTARSSRQASKRRLPAIAFTLGTADPHTPSTADAGTPRQLQAACRTASTTNTSAKLLLLDFNRSQGFTVPPASGPPTQQAEPAAKRSPFPTFTIRIWT